ncbi:hypothetical protein ACH5RR_037080 [Cinchona calisaya]|uniref:Uncharacterized protein n=1 Tax=Cinchona calisaya TaxID=153742 RepID=A0ABD2Y7D7_9GENT
MTRVPVNVGHLIRQGFLESGRSGRPIFYAPSLIHHLCTIAGCSIGHLESLTHPRRKINRKYVYRMVREYEKHHQEKHPTQPQPQPQPQPPPSQRTSMIPIPPGLVFNAPVNEKERNDLQGYRSYSQMVIHSNLTVIGEALKITSLRTWVQPPLPPAWHFGSTRGQYYTPPVATIHHEGSSHAGVTGGDMDDDYEEAQPSEAEEGQEEME